MSRSEKFIQFVVVIIIAAVFTAIGNVLDGKHVFGPSLVGTLVLAGLASIGAGLSMLPGLNKLPMVFWVSLVAVVVSIPGVPGQAWVVSVTKEVSFLATTTPVLAYAGLSLGKDLGAFRRLSWRIIPVALAVAAGTFICAALLAQFMLHWEGII